MKKHPPGTSVHKFNPNPTIFGLSRLPYSFSLVLALKRALRAQKWKTAEPEPKLPGSYKKKVYHYAFCTRRINIPKELYLVYQINRKIISWVDVVPCNLK